MKKENVIKIGSLLVLVYFLSSFIAHTYYVSVCSLDYNTKEKKIEVAIKFITHDLETAIEQEQSIKLNIGKKNQYKKVDSVLNAYIFNNFQIKSEGERIPLNFLGTESHLDESFYVYYQTQEVSLPREIEISNTLLTQSFPEQENLTHVNFWDKQKSYSFNRINTVYTFKKDE